MKTALKIGFSTTTQHWKSTLQQSKFLIFTLILATLLESSLFHELSQILGWLNLNADYYDLRSIVDINLLDLSDNQGSLGDYLSGLSSSFFYELIILNSFFLGVYYHHRGFWLEDETSSSGGMETILDTPIKNRQGSLSQVFQYIEKENRLYYFKILILLIFVQVIGGIIGRFLYETFIVVGYTYYWLFRLVPYLLLLLLYLKWLDIPFSKFWGNQYKWSAVVVFTILIPIIGSYIFSIIIAIPTILAYVLSSFIEINNILYFLVNIVYFMLLVPFISIFYSQTLIYFKNEAAT